MSHPRADTTPKPAPSSAEEGGEAARRSSPVSAADLGRPSARPRAAQEGPRRRTPDDAPKVVGGTARDTGRTQQTGREAPAE
eukprot:11510427-Alexandrium_andersonii.AAC.1